MLISFILLIKLDKDTKQTHHIEKYMHLNKIDPQIKLFLALCNNISGSFCNNKKLLFNWRSHVMSHKAALF